MTKYGALELATEFAPNALEMEFATIHATGTTGRTHHLGHAQDDHFGVSQVVETRVTVMSK